MARRKDSPSKPAAPKKPAKKPAKKPPRGLADRDAARLEALRATGLLADLDAAQIAALFARGPRSDDLHVYAGEHGDLLAGLIEAHFAHAARADLVIDAPQSIEAFTRLPLGLATDAVIADDPDGNHVHLLAGVAQGMYAPRTFDHWVATYDAALAAAGDARRFVRLVVHDYSEPVYLLATPDQYAALVEAELEDAHERIELPRRVSVTSRVTTLAKSLALKGVPARGAGERVLLELDRAAAARLVATLRADLHHDRRVATYVRREIVGEDRA